MDQKWHSLKLEQVYKELNTDSKGISETLAKARLQKYGPNQLKGEKKITPLEIFARQFKSALVIILIIATLISAGIGHFLDAGVIGVIIVLNAVFGFVQEFKAEKAMEALKRMAAPQAIALRDGKKVKIDASKLVPGDIIILNEGDRVPADAIIIDSANLDVDEASLTGESVPVSKEEGIVKENAIVSERSNMVFASTVVTHGHCTAIIVGTAMLTEIGKIAKAVHETVEEKTPLQKKLASVAKFLGIAIVIICGAMFGIGALLGIDLVEMFITAVALAVAAVPEGLPAVVTITLAIGLKTMAKRKAIVRKLPVTETLGAATVICSDKTGTLTKNEMTIQEIYTNGETIEVTGSGYNPDGDFKKKGKLFDPVKDEHTKLLLEVGSLCNLAELEKEKGWKITGDPTEAALIVAAAKAGLKKEEVHQQYKKLHEIAFDSERKRMTTIHKHPKKNIKFAAVKGAPDVLIKYCTQIYESGKVRKLTESEKKRVLEINKQMTSKALRVLGLAYRELPVTLEKFTPENIEKNLTFIGLVGMIDPPRPEVKNALHLCKQAGIKVVMITGDNKDTASAVAKQIGLEGDKILTGEELDKLSEKQLAEQVNEISIYARVSPQHKTKIIDGLKDKGHIVAMTGDGVNDAPALKKADIGVAMGIKGTDVAKEASDIVLQDDNFATIVAAIEEGRSIYDNIKKFVRYLLSCNIGEILTIFVAFMLAPLLWQPILGKIVLPLLAVQILLMNLLTDGLPALALGVDPPDKGIMLRKPRNPDEKPVDKLMIVNILIVGITMAIGTLFLFHRAIMLGFGPVTAQTIAFTTIVVFQLFNVFNARSEDKSIFQGSAPGKWLLIALASSAILQFVVVYLPPFQVLFSTIALPIKEISIIILTGASILLVVEAQKAVFRHLSSTKT